MNPLLIEIVVLLLGFVLLSKGADTLVDGGVGLAQRWGMDATIIGLTVIAWGTSMPEIVVVSYASYTGKAGAALGTVLGSNVANIGLVLGVTALILPRVLLQGIGRREIFWLFASLGLLTFLAWDGALDRQDAGILLGAFALYEVLLFMAPRNKEDAMGDQEEVAAHSIKKPGRAVLMGSVVIAVGARCIMYGGEGIATRFGISQAVIGLTIFAVGTSLPELAAGIGSARRGHAGLGLGNVLGSNVFNTLGVLGIAAMIRPIELDPASLAALQDRDLWVNGAFCLALIGMPLYLGKKFGRLQASVLLSGYVAYMAYLFLDGKLL
ncbi:MAG: cation:H+ antiporter [Planctomycetota bacterium]